MENNIFNIAFEFQGKPYSGWVNPSEKLNGEAAPSSFHVVLNEVSFGNLAFKDCKWSINEQRPSGLVKMVGKQIEKHYQL
jgi:hypothetical protein